MICKNCHTSAEGTYCSNCGARTFPQRFTLKSILYNAIVSPFIEHKRSLPFTIRELTLAPGKSIRKYVEGERDLLYSSDKFLFLIGTLTTILTFRYRFFSNEFTDTEGDVNSLIIKFFHLENKKTFIDSFFLYAEEYSTITNIIAIPVFAFFSYLFFKDKKFTFGENLVLNTYITAQQLFFLVAIVPLIEFFPGIKYEVISVYSAAIIVYNVIVFIQFFESPLIKGAIISIIAIVVSYVVQFFLNLLIYACFGSYFRLLDNLKVI